MLIKKDFLLPEHDMSNCEFEKIASQWLDSIKPQLKESSIVKYTNILNLHLLPEFGAWESACFQRAQSQRTFPENCYRYSVCSKKHLPLCSAGKKSSRS